MKKLSLILALLLASPLSLLAQRTSGSIAANATCVKLSVSATSTSVVSIGVSGTWSATIQAETIIAGQTAQNTNVYPYGSTTSQGTITANGNYNVSVPGIDQFQVCTTAYVSGTANIVLIATQASGGNGRGGGGAGTNNPGGSAGQIQTNAGSVFGAFTAAQDATINTTTGNVTVQGIDTVPLCTGFTPTNGQALQYTTASSPNPCWTAASSGGTVNSGTAGQLAYYATSTNAVSAMGTDFTFSTHTLTAGASSIFSFTGGATMDLSALGGSGTFKIPTTTNCTAASTRMLCYDSTAAVFHIYNQGGDSYGLTTTSTDTTTTHAVFASATAGLYTSRAIAAGDLPTSGIPNVVYNNTSNTFTSAGTVDLSAATGSNALKVPSQASLASNGTSSIGYDTTAKNFHIPVNGVDSLAASVPAASPPVNGDCAQFTVSSGNVTLSDAGAACGTGGGGGANTALSNLVSVGVNTALTPGNDATIALDSLTKRWTNLWLSGVLGWTNGSGTQDTGLSRDAAGVVDIGNGTAGDTSGTGKGTVFQSVGNGGYLGAEGSCASIATGAGFDAFCPNSSKHWIEISGNGGTLEPVAGLNGVLTANDIPSFKNGNELQDSGIATASVVTAASNFTSGQIVQAAASNRTTQSGNLSGDVTTNNSLATTVAQIQGTTVTLTAPAAGQLLDIVSGPTISNAFPGVPIDVESGSTYTVRGDGAGTDRVSVVQTTNNTTSTAITVPQAGSTGFDHYFTFAHINSGSVVATDTPTTSTINANTTAKLVGQVSGHNPEGMLWYSLANGSTNNYIGLEILPTDGNGLLAAEGFPGLTGDATASSGSYATTVVKVNGGSVPTSATVLGSNGSNQLVAASLQGNGTKAQLSTGTTTTNDCVKFDANGNTVDAGAACAGGTPTFPITVAGTVTSGGIPYFSSTTVESSSALLAANAIVQGGGAGTAPTTGNGDFTIDGTAHTLKSGASGLVDFSGITGATGFKVPVAAGATAGAAGVVDYDSTNKLTHIATNNLDSIAAATTSTSTTTTQALFATGTAGVYNPRAIATGDLPTSGIPNVVYNNTTNTATSAMTLDMSGATGATAFKVPVIAGATAGAAGVIDYDSTNKLTHVATNGADSIAAATTSTSTTTTQALFATGTAGVYNPRAIATGDLPAAVVYNNAANTGTSAMTLDMHAATTANALQVPSQASLTSNGTSSIGYDTTSKNFHIPSNGVDSLAGALAASGSYTNNDCVKLAVSSGTVTLADAGAGCGGGGSPALSSVTGSTAQATGTESAAGDNYTFAGVENAALTYPFVFTNASNSNNSSGALIINTTGTGTSQVPLAINEGGSGTNVGDIQDWYLGSTVSNGVLSGGTKEAAITSAGALALGSAPTNAAGTGGFIVFSEGTGFTGASSTDGVYANSSNHCATVVNQTSDGGCIVAVSQANTFGAFSQSFASASAVILPATGTGTATNTALAIQAGLDAATTGATAALTLRGEDVNGGSTASLAGGAVTLRGGNNASTGNSNAGGAATVNGGDVTGATGTTKTGGAVTVRGGNYGATTGSGTPGTATITGGGFTAAFTNGAGSDVLIQGGLGTGNAAVSHVKLQGPALSQTSGTTAQAEVTRWVTHVKAGSTTSATATNMFNVALANNQGAGVAVTVTVFAQDATPHNCQTTQSYTFSAQDTAGTVTTNVQTIGSPATICDTGTLTLAVAASAAAPTVFSVTPSWTTISPATVTITVEIHNLSQQDISLL